MDKSWRKLNVLVPNPDCSTKDGEITEWRDVRPQPTTEEIEAVTNQMVEDSELDTEAGGALNISKVDKLLFLVNFDQENRLRVLEGRTNVTKAQYKTALKDQYKTIT
jgi:hypothetical protein